MDRTSQLYISAEAIIGAITIVGNALVLVAILKNRQLQTITNCFIASLAVADLLVGIVVAPLAALSHLGLPKNFMGCVFTNSIVVAFTQVSIFNLLAVAFERFFAIKHPFAYQKHMTIKYSMLINAGVWTLGLLFGLIPMFGWNLKKLVTDDWMCNFVTVIDMEYVVYFHFFGCIIIPLLIIVAIYVYIYLIVRKQMSQIAALEIPGPNQGRSKSKFKREIKAAKSLAIVILLFGLCWIPIHVLNSLTLLCRPGSCAYPQELLLTTIVLSHANSAVNPFLYAYGNSNFKHAFERMFCKKEYWSENASTLPSSRPLPQNVSSDDCRNDQVPEDRNKVQDFKTNGTLHDDNNHRQSVNNGENDALNSSRSSSECLSPQNKKTNRHSGEVSSSDMRNTKLELFVVDQHNDNLNNIS
ncbi:adenosine receptor A1-like [Mya arenaria]|uniref:adenosine receptor A1-like n=1 Tax=Mya arenaria TaxID=6604 RepID=UPI0022E68CBC|nr:adenosine receptor A1-like [Mya arenaria]XP_052767767.1 adenosine receptor A1-like [Mya arenaria]XP_052767768.1 adenosine receptor A1-like [Mya arenaria]